MAAYFGGALPSPCHSDVTDDVKYTYSDNVHSQMATGQDINVVLDNVIVQINRITDHLRVTGENEAANHFIRDMTGTFRALYNVVAPWSSDKCLMAPSPPEPIFSIQENTPSEATTGDTWAAVAATEPVVNENGIIKFRPSDAVKTTITAQQEVNMEHGSRARRVVWVQPWDANRPLSNISTHIREVGPIYSMAFSPEAGAVCIIFQHAHHAVQFMHDCAEYVGQHGISPFGREHHVSPGQVYPYDEELQRMDPPYNERRRLTFARAQLFSSGINREQFRKDIEDVVGASNIERVWLFNTGNATVVLTAVPLAKMVSDVFRKYSRARGHPYEGVQVSFSHDPCERNLHLVSQIPGHANFIGTNGHSNTPHPSGRQVRSATFSTGSSFASRRPSTASSEQPMKNRINGSMKPTVDEDGWQTVPKRR